MVGIYIAFYLAIAADEDHGFGRIAKIIETPLFLVCNWLVPDAFFLCHICFWAVLCGSAGFGVGILLSKLLDD